ncbi:aspartate/glutamate racemase family protein [Burkholderia alba]|uniref:aspartate/glutamate racemase family protein n=1 Tax=Burkholderia alba TaxID=2683677 RepID=UPI002B053C0D|nr:amino acid racemase [Burkholderia alba]
MKKIGLIGGLGYPSTITYYELINRLGNQYLGGVRSPRIVLESLDFQDIADWLTADDRAAATGELRAAAARLVAAGAELIAMCCNTVHKFAPEVAAGLPVPLVNICECTAEHAQARGFGQVALLGSAYSMEERFYHVEFERRGIVSRVPGPDERRFMQTAIETELCVGTLRDETRTGFIEIARRQIELGAQALALACTEIPLVIRADDFAVPVIDTVAVHAAAIVARAACGVAQRVGASAE